MVTAITMTYAEEAVGLTRAAANGGDAGGDSFTLETDGRLPAARPRRGDRSRSTKRPGLLPPTT